MACPSLTTSNVPNQEMRVSTLRELLLSGILRTASSRTLVVGRGASGLLCSHISRLSTCRAILDGEGLLLSTREAIHPELSNTYIYLLHLIQHNTGIKVKKIKNPPSPSPQAQVSESTRYSSVLPMPSEFLQVISGPRSAGNRFSSYLIAKDIRCQTF